MANFQFNPKYGRQFTFAPPNLHGEFTASRIFATPAVPPTARLTQLLPAAVYEVMEHVPLRCCGMTSVRVQTAVASDVKGKVSEAPVPGTLRKKKSYAGMHCERRYYTFILDHTLALTAPVCCLTWKSITLSPLHRGNGY